MKEIRLKPTLQIGEEVRLIKFGGSAGIITIDDVNGYGISGHREGQPKNTVICDWHTFDIIESPDESNKSQTKPSAFNLLLHNLQSDNEYAWSWHCNIAMCAYDCSGITHIVANEIAAKVMTRIFEIDTTELKEYIELKKSWGKYEQDIEPLVKCKHDFSASTGDEGTGCYICKHCGAQPNDAELSEILSKEKPPLKLRVGGVYRNIVGQIVEILNKRENKFIAKDGRVFFEDGKLFDDNFDLIEEVQQTEVVEYCNCKNETVTFDGYRHWCNGCKKLCANAVPKPTVAGKVAVENKRLNIGDLITYTQTGEIVCVHKNGYSIKFCDREIYLPDHLVKLKKPSSNPFKIGDKINFWYEQGQKRTGKIIGGVIDDNLIFVRVEHSNQIADYWVHYKQCELVEE